MTNLPQKINIRTHQLCQLFPLSRNTLRFYRDQGLLQPKQGTNGYYHYTAKDIASLFFSLSLQAKFGRSLTSIRNQLNQASVRPDLSLGITEIDQNLHAIEIELQRLQKKKERLLSLKDYRLQLLESVNQITWVDQTDGLDYIEESDFLAQQAEIRKLTKHHLGFQGLLFSIQQLEEKWIYPTYILGITHRSNQESQLQFHSRRHIPSGKKALRYTLQIDRLDRLDSSIFQEVLATAKKEKATLYPIVTSLILDVHQQPESYIVMFRFLLESTE